MTLQVSSIQEGRYSHTASDGVSFSIPISTVDPSRAVVFISEKATDDNAGRSGRYMFRASLTANAINLVRLSTSYSPDGEISWTVVEFAPGSLVSLQAGSVTPPAGTTLSVSLTAVDPAATIPILSRTRYTSDSGNAWDGGFAGTCEITQTSVPGDTLLFTFGISDPDWQADYQVIEFNSSDVTVQSGLIHTLENQTSGTATITAVDLTRALISCGGVRSNRGAYSEDRMPTRLSFNSSTEVLAERYSDSSYTSYYYDIYYYVAEFTGATVESGLTSMASTATVATASFTALGSDSFQWLGDPAGGYKHTGSNSGGTNKNLVLADLAATRDTLTFERGAASAGIDFGWFVLDLSGAGGIQLSGNAPATATAQGELSTAINLSGTADVIASVAGELVTGITLTGNASAMATAQGELSTGISLSGQASVTAAASGELSTSITLAGTATATATASGDLASGPGAQLSGNASATATASGELTTGISLGDTAPVTATVQGELSTAITLSGTADVIATVAGELATGITLSGTATATVTAQGELATEIGLAGQAAITATATGELTVGQAWVPRETTIARATPARDLARATPQRTIERI